MARRALFALLIGIVPGLARAEGTAAPFQAWLALDSAYIRAGPSSSSPIVGLLRRGDVVTVTGCVPSCDPGRPDSARAWALLGSDGAVRLSLLTRTVEDELHRALSAEARYVYGTVRVQGAPVYKAPESKTILHRLKAGRVLAFVPKPSTAVPGWLECAEGGFVRASEVRLARPSTFSGAHDESLPIAFAIRKARVRPSGSGHPAPAITAARYTRWPVLAIDGDTVQTPAGIVSRRDVRLVLPHPRPAGVASDAKWVHVNLEEQTLTAYEGDRPVFTTLVSTGKPGHETPMGLFGVWLKTVHHRMTGPPQEPYEVDEVPFTMFFRRGVALHGAFWHDAFGSVVSHGCVNLSVADAEWLFNWAPPRLPEGWHAVIPGPSHQTTLAVLVDRSPPPRRWKPAPAVTVPVVSAIDEVPR